MIIGKKKIKEKLFHEIKVRINGETKKDIEDAMEYIKNFAFDYKGNCEFVIYYHY